MDMHQTGDDVKAEFKDEGLFRGTRRCLRLSTSKSTAT
jgi:hypothetical protein